jgi:hypothetical protein
VSIINFSPSTKRRKSSVVAKQSLPGRFLASRRIVRGATEHFFLCPPDSLHLIDLRNKKKEIFSSEIGMTTSILQLRQSLLQREKGLPPQHAVQREGEQAPIDPGLTAAAVSSAEAALQRTMDALKEAQRQRQQARQQYSRGGADPCVF